MYKAKDILWLFTSSKV